MKFVVFQFDISDEQFEQPEIRNLYLDAIMKPTDAVLKKARQFYTRVCEIEADSFEQVFEIGNIGSEESIHRIRPMRSVSVGDLIKCYDTREMKFVAPVGFQEIHF